MSQNMTEQGEKDSVWHDEEGVKMNHFVKWSTCDDALSDARSWPADSNVMESKLNFTDNNLNKQEY